MDAMLLKKFFGKKSLSFGELGKGLASNRVAYYLGKLVDEGKLVKKGKKYFITGKGQTVWEPRQSGACGF